MDIDSLKFIETDYSLINSCFGKLRIIDGCKYRHNKNVYVKVECDCGNSLYVQLGSLKSGHTKSCGYCRYNFNEYQILNEYISFLKIYDTTTCDWDFILINTEIVDFLKSLCNWQISYHSSLSQRKEIRGTICTKTGKIHISLHRVIVDYINSKYNLPKLLDNQEIDHIDGNTFNNLYYPYDDYYNNLRVCNRQQNSLNRRCNGYEIINCKNGPKYRSSIEILNKHFSKTFNTINECLEYNNHILSEVYPEGLEFYYHSKSNPRNNKITFSNLVLNNIGFND